MTVYYLSEKGKKQQFNSKGDVLARRTMVRETEVQPRRKQIRAGAEHESQITTLEAKERNKQVSENKRTDKGS